MKKESLHQYTAKSIADQLTQDINDGMYPIGARLPAERTLAERFHVSRPTIRNALKHLEAFGCIETKIGSGSYVKSADTRAVSNALTDALLPDGAMNCDVIEVRMIFDPEIAAMAAARRTPEQLKAVRAIADEMRGKAEAGDEDYLRLDEEFHLALARAANNPVLLHLVEACRGIYAYTVRLSAEEPKKIERTLRQHDEILLAVENRDTKRARQLMRQHVLRTLYPAAE